MIVVVASAGLSGAGGEENTAAEPSVRQLSAWLDVFNSGDRERYAEFLADRFPARLAGLDKEMAFRELTGGFDLRKLERVSATEARGLVQERASDQFARFKLTVAATEPHVIVSLEGTAIPRPAEFPIARLTEGEAIAGVQAVLREDAAEDRFSGAVLVAKNGQVLFSRAYGLADRERGIPNTLQTRFRIGSMNKMFTAVAILQLAEAGQVELTAPLGEYLTGYPNRDVAAKVTIHHLLTHTGGTGDIFGPEFKTHRQELRALGDYVRLYGDRGLQFEPGSRWQYSNYGFILLGAVIEKVTGQTYYDYVQRAHLPAREHDRDRVAARTRSGPGPVDRIHEAAGNGHVGPGHRHAALPRNLRRRRLLNGRGPRTVRRGAAGPPVAPPRLHAAADHRKGGYRAWRQICVRVRRSSRHGGERLGGSRRRRARHERGYVDMPEVRIRGGRAGQHGSAGSTTDRRLARRPASGARIAPAELPAGDLRAGTPVSPMRRD